MSRWKWILGVALSVGLAHADPDDFEAAFARGKALLAENQFRLASETLEKARDSAEGPVERARAEGWLGVIHYRMHRETIAEPLLTNALAVSGLDAGDRSRWLAVLADIQGDRGQAEMAIRTYDQALAASRGDASLSLGIRLGRAQILPAPRRLPALQDIAASTIDIKPEAVRVRFLINIGTQAEQLGTDAEQLSYESFHSAAHLPGVEPRFKAEALGGLARLYQRQSRLDEARRLNSQAIRAAEAANAADLLADMLWRSGRLNRALNHPMEAQANYLRAIGYAEAIRADLPPENRTGQSAFQESLKPLYLEYAGSLLAQARSGGSGATGDLLREARATVELARKGEMEDFLGGRCALPAARKAPAESFDTKTAVLYPILYPDRLELLVSSGDEMQGFSVPVDAKSVEAAVENFIDAIRRQSSEATDHGQKLYGWLIKPIEAWLGQHRTEILVAVPDGPLRRIPMAALHDGHAYLMERYAVATSPGLDLLPSAPSRTDARKRVLLAGLSRPGPVIDRLPEAFFDLMTATRAGPLDPSGRDQLRRDPSFRRGLEERMVLPGVDREIAALEKIVGQKAFLNEAFTAENLGQEVATTPFSVVHIASHGVFGPTADSTFLLAHDTAIDVAGLEKILKTEKYRQNSIDLLVLSACRTAEGDDRSPLGLSGIAIKAGVPSVIGSLWPVSDNAASEFMQTFYSQFTASSASKAQALRQAQKKLLADSRFAHPYYWSAFILVGNWL